MKALVFDFFGVIYRSEYDAGPLDQDILALVLQLKKDYKTALLSNVHGLFRYVDEGLISQYFDVLAPSDMLGYEKPDPRAYGAVLEQLGVAAAEAVLIDDISSFVAAGKAVGMQGIVYSDIGSLKAELKSLGVMTIC